MNHESPRHKLVRAERTSMKHLASQAPLTIEKLSKLPTRTRFSCLESRIHTLEGKVGTLEYELDHSNAMNAQALHENLRLHNQLYGASNYTGRVLDMGDAEIITSEVANTRLTELELVRKEKETEKKSRNDARQQAEYELQRQRREEGENLMFDQPLARLQKKGLRNLCWSLTLAEDGSIKDMIERVQAQFDSNPELKLNPRYTGLFKLRRAKHQRTEDEPLSTTTEETAPSESVSQHIAQRPQPRPKPKPAYQIPASSLSNTPPQASTSYPSPSINSPTRPQPRTILGNFTNSLQIPGSVN